MQNKIKIKLKTVDNKTKYYAGMFKNLPLYTSDKNNCMTYENVGEAVYSLLQLETVDIKSVTIE